MRPARDPEAQLAQFCEVCRRPLISRPVRLTGRCGAHPRQPVLPFDDEPPDDDQERNPRR